MRQRDNDKAQRMLERMAERTAKLDLRTAHEREGAAAVLVGITRLAALIGVAGSPSGKAGKEAEFLVKSLSRLFSEKDERQRYVTEMLKDLNTAVALTGIWHDREDQIIKPRRANFLVKYSVQIEGRTKYLVEEREGLDRRDVRVPKSDYTAATAAIAEANGEPLKFEELLKKFEKHGGQQIPSKYPLRTVLRFWRSCEPPVVTKAHARYQFAADNAKEFKRAAKEAWENLKSLQESD